MNRVNELVIVKDDYRTKEEFENAIRDAIMVLLNNNYIMTVKYDANEKDLGIIVIHYNYAQEEMGAAYPEWLYPEERESVVWEDA